MKLHDVGSAKSEAGALADSGRPRYRTELVLTHDLFASHSLDTREEPHEHLWRVELRFTGEPVRGRIVDFPRLETAVRDAFAPYDRVYLNSCALLTPEARAFPTCETLGESFFGEWEDARLPVLHAAENPTLELLSIRITLMDPDGRTYGAAITSRA